MNNKLRIKLDKNNYIINLYTADLGLLEGYIEPINQEYPSDVGNMCYQYINNEYVLDEEKLAKIKAESSEAIVKETTDNIINDLAERGII